jgi:hypothetical protein
LTLTSNINPKIDPRAYLHHTVLLNTGPWTSRSLDIPKSPERRYENVAISNHTPGTIRQKSPKMKNRTPGNVHPGRPTTSPTASSRSSPPRTRIRSWPLTCRSSGSIFGSMRMCFFFLLAGLNPYRVSVWFPIILGPGTDVSIVLFLRPPNRFYLQYKNVKPDVSLAPYPSMPLCPSPLLVVIAPRDGKTLRAR